MADSRGHVARGVESSVGSQVAQPPGILQLMDQLENAVDNLLAG
jgi:hypothetical protein